MKICYNVEKKKKEAPLLIGGHLYQHDDGRIYIYAKYQEMLINLDSGGQWSPSRGGRRAIEYSSSYDPNRKEFGAWFNTIFGWSGDKFTDVTDQYCLRKIKED